MTGLAPVDPSGRLHGRFAAAALVAPIGFASALVSAGRGLRPEHVRALAFGLLRVRRLAAREGWTSFTATAAVIFASAAIVAATLEWPGIGR